MTGPAPWPRARLPFSSNVWYSGRPLSACRALYWPSDDPEAVLSELPRARVVSHRRRADRARPRSSIRSATSISTSRSRREHGLRIAHVFLTHFHADFVAGHLELRDRDGRRDLSRRRRQGRVRVHAAARRRRRRVRARAAPGARDAGPHARVDLDSRVRPRRAARPAARRPHRRHAVRRRRRAADLRVALGWSAADLGGLLYDSLHDEAAGAARREPRLPGARRRVALRQGAQQGNRLDHRRAAARRTTRCSR